MKGNKYIILFLLFLSINVYSMNFTKVNQDILLSMVLIGVFMRGMLEIIGNGFLSVIITVSVLLFILSLFALIITLFYGVIDEILTHFKI